LPLSLSIPYGSRRLPSPRIAKPTRITRQGWTDGKPTGQATERKSQATRTYRPKRPTLSASPCGRVNAPTNGKRATLAKFTPFTAQAEDESESRTTHGKRERPISGEKRQALTTTQAENKRAAKGFKPRHGAQAEKIRNRSRRRSPTPHPIGEGEKPPRLLNLRKKPLSVPFLFFFGLYIYSLLSLLLSFFSCRHCAKTAHFFVIFTNAPSDRAYRRGKAAHRARIVGEGKRTPTRRTCTILTFS
jgi:hypothetical protein